MRPIRVLGTGVGLLAESVPPASVGEVLDAIAACREASSTWKVGGLVVRG